MPVNNPDYYPVGKKAIDYLREDSSRKGYKVKNIPDESLMNVVQNLRKKTNKTHYHSKPTTINFMAAQKKSEDVIKPFKSSLKRTFPSIHSHSKKSKFTINNTPKHLEKDDSGDDKYYKRSEQSYLFRLNNQHLFNSRNAIKDDESFQESEFELTDVESTHTQFSESSDDWSSSEADYDREDEPGYVSFELQARTPGRKNFLLRDWLFSSKAKSKVNKEQEKGISFKQSSRIQSFSNGIYFEEFQHFKRKNHQFFEFN